MTLVWKSKQGEDNRFETHQGETEMALALKALGHPKRLHILRILQSRDSCLCGDLVSELSLAQSTVSQHLGILKRVGLLQEEVDGPRHRYRLRSKRLRDLEAYLKDLTTHRQNTIE